AAGLLLDDRPDLVDVLLGHRDAVLLQDLDGLPDPRLDVARRRPAGRRRAGRTVAAAPSAATAGVATAPSATAGVGAGIATGAVAAQVRPALGRVLHRLGGAGAGPGLARLADAGVTAVDVVQRLHRVGDRRIRLVQLALDVLGRVLGDLLVLLAGAGLGLGVGDVRAGHHARLVRVVEPHGLLGLGVVLLDLLLRVLADLLHLLLGVLQHVGQRVERLGRLLQLAVDFGARRAQLGQVADQRVRIGPLLPR